MNPPAPALPEPEFDLVLRGFHRAQVADVIEQGLRALASPASATISAERLRSPEFDVVLRGLDHQQVLDYLDLLADRLEGRQDGRQDGT
ncbi:hypothetical protein [Nocardiopsis listeri]|uniref:hypothetical protein n=1 Tax=Nocardiopsis listeri TaxID=53440 RepID=UPI00083714FA|nr:hypothetical protein [Nocardiopsis listeri]